MNCHREAYVINEDTRYEEDLEGRPVEWNQPTFDYVQDGNLVLQAGKSYGQKLWSNPTDYFYSNRYIGSDIETLEYYSYGYFEIRAKMNLSEGIMSSFWLCGDRNAESKMEYEIDIFECHGKYPGLFKQTALGHYYPNGFTGSSSEKESTGNLYMHVKDITNCFKTPTLTQWCKDGALGARYTPDDLGTESYFHVEDLREWHTYGLDWRKDSITWYIDGIATSRMEIPKEGVKRTVWTASGEKEMTYYFNEPMRLILGVGVDSSNVAPWSYVGDDTDWENGSSMVIDYVRIYQYD